MSFMGVFFRFNEEGRIEVVKLPFSRKVSEKDFEEKSKFIDEEVFFSKYPKESETLKKQLEEVKYISNQRISRVGMVMQFLFDEGMVPSGCYVGDKYFPRFHEDGTQRKKAIEYGYRFYGKVFMDEIIKKKYLDNPPDDYYKKKMEDYTIYSGSYFFAGEEMISEEEYIKYINRLKDLTCIRDARKPLETRTPKVNIKR